jgi:hypothetical protein
MVDIDLETKFEMVVKRSQDKKRESMNKLKIKKINISNEIEEEKNV